MTDDFEIPEVLKDGIELQNHIYNINEENLEESKAYLRTLLPKYEEEIVRTIYHAASIRRTKFKLLKSLIEIIPNYPINYDRFGCYLKKLQNENKDEWESRERAMFKRDCYVEINQNSEQIEKIFEEDNICSALVTDDLEKFTKLSAEQSLTSKYYNFQNSSYDLISLAGLFGAEKCFFYLISNDIPVDATCMTHAIAGGNEAIIEHCMSDNSDIFRYLPDYIRTAIEYHHNHIAKWLLEKDPSIMMNLSFCIKERNIEMFYYFLEKGADINETDPLIKNLVEKATFYGLYHVLAYLVEEKDLDVNSLNSVDQTALFLAAMRDYLDLTIFLLDHGAEYEMVDLNNHTPLEIALYNGNTRVYEYLSEYQRKDHETNDGTIPHE